MQLVAGRPFNEDTADEMTPWNNPIGVGLILEIVLQERVSSDPYQRFGLDVIVVVSVFGARFCRLESSTMLDMVTINILRRLELPHI